ncbi:MAG TPA: hypothetical protein VKY34_06400 [Xanthomarina sp.]|nr:hypothetical protein [Xanthomarina sp.]
MVKNITFLLVVILTNLSIAQQLSKDELLHSMAQETCDCINAKNVDFTNVNLDKLELELGMCILESYGNHKADADTFFNLSFDDESSLIKLGEDIAYKMMNECPKIIMAMAGSYIDEDEFSNMPPPPAPKNFEDLNLEAKLVSLNNDAISYIIVADEFNKEHIFIISEQFEDYSLLNKSNYNKNFKIFYKEVDFFDLSEKRYVLKKVIKYLELI